jgi:hypothetical protein
VPSSSRGSLLSFFGPTSKAQWYLCEIVGVARGRDQSVNIRILFPWHFGGSRASVKPQVQSVLVDGMMGVAMVQDEHRNNSVIYPFAIR